MTKGCIPEAPAGGHKSHAGTLLEGATAPVPEDPGEAAVEEEVDRVVPGALWEVPPLPPVEREPVDAALDVVPVAAALVVEFAEVDGIAGVVVTTGEVAVVPRLTTPPLTALPGVAVVCAKADDIVAIQNSAA